MGITDEAIAVASSDEVHAVEGTDVHPVTFEVIRHRLFRILQEGIITLKHVTGSFITTEAHDVVEALYRADGTLLMGGTGFLHHLIPAAEACKLILSRFGEDINDGDVFMVNDPYVSALHTSDVFIVTPIFHSGRLVAWNACFVHVYDIGAMSPGGFCPDARDVYSEGFSTKGLRLVERGEVRRDVFDTFLNMVRVPEMVALDMSAMIACGNVARRRVEELCTKYGVDVVEKVGDGLIAQSERLLRERLNEMPDGEWQARQYMQVEDDLFRINVSLKKEGGHLTFDFSGSSPQSEKYGINCSYWASLGGVWAPLFPLICHDMTWNAGLLEVVDTVAPEGSIVNAKRPAPTSIATTSAIQCINNLSSTVLSKMLIASGKHSKEATAVWHGNLLPLFVFGVNQRGLEVIGIQTETLGGSGGARTWSDGVDLGGELANPYCRMGNVETIEAMFPMRYLFRRRRRDSGGAGKFRGGAGGEYALMAHDSKSSLGYVISSKGFKHPMSEGLSAGYPGAPNRMEWVHADGRLETEAIRSEENLVGGDLKKEEVPWGTFPLEGQDALYVGWSGGGGVGDPLDRDEYAVQRDLSRELISADAARDIYGVVLASTGDVDTRATRERRSELRRMRLEKGEGGRVAGAREDELKGDILAKLSETLGLLENSGHLWISCLKCGYGLEVEGQPWKGRALLAERWMGAVGRTAYETSGEDVVLREFVCPKCGQLLDAETAVRGDPFLDDVVRPQEGR